MFILNKKSNTITECSHKDVIEVCRKDEKHYAVAATKEELLGAHQEPEKQPENTPDDNMNAQEQKTAPEGTQEGTEGAQGGNTVEGNEGSQGNPDTNTNEGIQEPGNQPEVSGTSKEDELNAMNVQDLRKIAKDAGIQGYGNMNKATLVQMILNH